VILIPTLEPWHGTRHEGLTICAAGISIGSPAHHGNITTRDATGSAILLPTASVRRPKERAGVYILIAGGGKVGFNLTTTLLHLGHEITLLERDRDRYGLLEERFGNVARLGDVTELFVLERAGVERAELLVAVTGDDEDNLVACQVARDKYGVPKVIARVNDPRNQSHFDMLDIRPTVSATATILALIEHELPQQELVTLLDLRRENLEIIEIGIDAGSAAARRTVRELKLPRGSRLISVSRDGTSQIATGETELRPGDRVMAILEPGAEDAIKQLLLADGGIADR
jgi:trk system potassium uptake protein